jgi:hypothetical protein
MTRIPVTCPDCGVVPGQPHKEGCDVEVCPHCGGQALGCDCEIDPADERRVLWSGVWPGVVECQRLGWYANMTDNGGGWKPCDKSAPGATEDLNRLYTDCDWDAAKQTWVPR